MPDNAQAEHPGHVDGVDDDQERGRAGELALSRSAAAPGLAYCQTGLSDSFAQALRHLHAVGRTRYPAGA
jgi:hypothetical protein